MEQFKYLGKTVTNHNYIQGEIKITLKAGNPICPSVQGLLSCSLLSKNIRIDIFRTIISLSCLYGCETWSHILREERSLRVFENGVLRRLFGPKKDEVTGEWRKLHNEKHDELYFLPNIIRVIKSRIMRWTGHVACMGKGEVNEGYWLGKKASWKTQA